MTEKMTGIHHVTAIARDPQKNLDFYSKILGLRLVKKTVNFDDPGTYHLYYGDQKGRPGTILTFFPWPNARLGSRGSGQATVTSFSVPQNSMGFWAEHLAKHGVNLGSVHTRFDEEAMAFYDPDGLKLEIVAHQGGEEGEPWTTGSIPVEHAIRGFHSVTLLQRELDGTVDLLSDLMGLRLAEEGKDRVRFESTGDDIGRQIDLVASPGKGQGRIAAGTVHHVAWRVEDDEAQTQWRERLIDGGFGPTEILDRQYFKSIYFREPGGVLFEFATDPPGFMRDEDCESLGTDLKLPPWLEAHRQRIERALPTLDVPEATS